MPPTSNGDSAFTRRERCFLACISLCALVLAALLGYWREVYVAEDKLRSQATHLSNKVEQLLAEGSTLTSALYSFYHSAGEMPAERFPVLVERLIRAHPQVGWAAYATRVDHDEIAEFESAMELEGFIDFAIHGPHEGRKSPYVLPINLLEPLSPTAAKVLGLNLLTAPDWREAIETTVSEARVGALFTKGLNAKDRGYLLTRATYRGTIVPEHPSERRRQLSGVFMTFVPEAAILSLAVADNEGLTVEIANIPPSKPGQQFVAHRSAHSLTKQRFDIRSSFSVAGKTHVLKISAEPDVNLVSIIAGLLVAGFALVIVFYALRWRRRSQIVENASIEKAMIAEATLSSVADAVIRTTESGVLTYLNPKARELAGQDIPEGRPTRIEELFQVYNAGDSLLNWSDLKAAINNGERLFVRLGTAKERVVSCRMTQVQTSDDDDAAEGIVLAMRDVSVEHKLAAEIEHQARHDPLTKLPNRREFERRLKQLVASTRSGPLPGKSSVLYLDLDQFKLVNDTCGHAAGDKMLQQLAGLLASTVRPPSVLARLGGDEFGVLLLEMDPERALKAAQRLCDAVTAFRFSWEERVFELGVSVGVVHLSRGSGTAEEVLRAADLACFAAKDLGRNRVHVYRPDDRTIARNEGEMMWQDEVKRAMADDRLVLHGQSIHSLSDHGYPNHLCELLIRMYREDGEICPPMAFIPAAERYGLMPQLDREVIALAFSHLAHGPDSNRTFTINLSGQSMADTALDDFVLRSAHAMQINPERVCFEVTETSAISNLNSARQLMFRLRDHGFQFALDDFGAGLSSFRYLKQLPINYLKIDGQFIRDLDADAVSRTMVDSIVRVARVLDVQTIGEMVENEQIMTELRALGVDYAQGYHLGRPAALTTQMPLAKSA